MNGNRNHPPKGSTIKVDPIKETKDIQAIKRLLSDKPRDLCLFTLGINTNLRASDLVKLTVGQVRHLKPGDDLAIKETKTKKPRRMTLNKAVIKAVQAYLNERDAAEDSEPLFVSNKGKNAITVQHVHRLVKSWCKMVNLIGNYGSHTLRKTFGYHQRVTFGAGLAELMTAFNHSRQSQTLDYLCIQADEVKSLYLNVL